MKAGLYTLIASYGASVVLGLAMINYENDNPGTVCGDCDSTGKALLVPMVGPWLALSRADGERDKAACALLGLAQATGVVLSIVGIARYVSSGTPGASSSMSSDMMVGLAPTQGGAFGSVRAAF